MAMTLMIENINNDFTAYPSGRSEITPNGSYYRFYQSKLRQLVTQTRYRKEQEARIAREKQANENRIAEQRLHREYMNHIRERKKAQAQDIVTNKQDVQQKRSDSVMSNPTRTITLNIISASFSPTIEIRTKPVTKPKQAPVPAKQPRIISAPTSSQRVINKPKIIPTIKIEGVEESLSKANIHSFTQVSSSSSLPNLNKKTQHARRLILDTIMLHLDTHISSDESKLPVYEDINNKFSSSIAPTVYQCFERLGA